MKSDEPRRNKVYQVCFNIAIFDRNGRGGGGGGGGRIQKPTGSIIKAAHNLKIFVMSASVTPENQIEELLLEDKRVTYLQIFQ